jgi:hypothetical protein
MKRTRSIKKQKVVYVIEIPKSDDKEEHEHSLSPFMLEFPEPSI